MNIEKIINLIKAICIRSQELEGYLNKTKLLKLLYLIDLEYYREHDKIYTGFNWTFYKFGPWAYEYNNIYEQLEASSDFKITKKGVPEETQYIFCTLDYKNLNILLPNPSDSLLVKTIVEKWATEDLSKLLNFVYFYTEPMEDTVKGEKLDFTKIKSLERIPEFKLKKGTLSNKLKQELYEKLRNSIGKKKSNSLSKEIRPEYDKLYFSVMEKLDFDKDY
jgi:hypothetical protein